MNSLASSQPVIVERIGRLLVARLSSPPVNALGVDVRRGLAEALEAANADEGVAALLVIGSGAMFSGGADISEFDKPMLPPLLPELIDRFEDSAKPTIAAINGTAMGGALELSMGCHYRVAAETASMGLPEVKIGIIPGAGGTQRMPRLIGAAAALDLIVAGKTVAAPKALAAGLVDHVAPAPAEGFEAAAIAWADQLIASGAGPRPTRERSVVPAPDAFVAMRQRVGDGPAAFAARRCIDAVEASTTLAFRDGMRRESELFLECAQSPTSAALIHLFFAERQSGKVPGVDAGTKARPLAKAAVIGAGTMGGGIAIALADAGLEVSLIDTSAESLQRGLARLDKHYESLVARGRLSADRAKANRARISGGDDAALGACDLVIEAVFEDLALKQSVFRDLDRLCKPGAVLATNTSTLDVDAIAAVTSRPQDVVGLHFFSPANIMRLLEIVRGRETAPDALATALALARRMGKVGVVCGVCFGFIGNRMLEGYAREAGLLLLEGASPAEIDAAVTGFGFAMGPFAMSDLAGIDVGYRVRKEHGVAPGDEKYFAVGEQLFHLGRYGQKTGAGFYRYEQGQRTPAPDAEVERIAAEQAARFGIERRTISAEEIAERCVLPLINEGARILEEGIALRAGDIDLVWIYGYGFPAWRGGPMHYANTLGPGKIVERMRAIGRDDPYWKPAALLERLAAEGARFS